MLKCASSRGAAMPGHAQESDEDEAEKAENLAQERAAMCPGKRSWARLPDWCETGLVSLLASLKDLLSAAVALDVDRVTYCRFA